MYSKFVICVVPLVNKKPHVLKEYNALWDSVSVEL